MNIKELIERIEELKNLFGNKAEYIEIDAVIELISKLDEPQKVVVPQFVADWIKYCKFTNVDLYHALEMGDLYFYNYANQKDDLKLKEFLETEKNQEIFARAWLDGYEIEKEKRYLVKMKGVVSGSAYLKQNAKDNYWYFGTDSEKGSIVIKHTRKEIEKNGFGWVFDCEGIEIEEVEE